MDGYAVRSADLAAEGDHRLRVVEEIHAGRTPGRRVGPGEAALIMTGAPLPPGGDAVVMIERCRAIEGDVIVPGPVAPGSNRLLRGRELRAGELVLAPGARILGPTLGLLASCGRFEVDVVRPPAVTVVSTGDELVPPSGVPGPGQIRDSNSAMLAGLADARGARPVVQHPIVPDDPAALRSAFERAMASDILLISGGVSAGRADFIPSTLLGLGVEPVFHKVRVKPGKPIWFGVAPTGTLVFGLPGNPGGALIGFLLFVGPALDALAGRGGRAARTEPGRLAKAFRHRGDRPTYHPSVRVAGGIEPVDWAGSADLRAMALADGFLAFPSGDRDYDAGEAVAFLPLDDARGGRSGWQNPGDPV